MTAPTDAPATAGPVWTASAVARRFGMAPGTLRSWSQRYGIGPAAHTPGRHRRYTATDVAELEAIRSLLQQGVALPAAAALVRDQRRTHAAGRSARPTSPPAPPATVDELMAASARLDSAAATDIVTAAVAEHGVPTAWEQLCRPALDGLGPAVGADQGCVDSELLLSWVLATCLRRLPVPAQGRPVLLACMDGEQHTLGLEALHAALAERDVPARMLGASVPAPALRHATTLLRPRAVVLWAQRATTAEAGVLAELTAHTDSVLAAGPGWCRADLPTAVLGVDNLRAALALLTPAAA